MLEQLSNDLMSASMLRFRLQVWRGRKAAAQEVIDSRDSTVSDAVQAIKDKKNAERRIKELEAWI